MGLRSPQDVAFACHKNIVIGQAFHEALYTARCLESNQLALLAVHALVMRGNVE